MTDNLPEPVADILRALEIELDDDASFRKAKIGISDYGRWVLENNGRYLMDENEADLREVHASYIDDYLKHLKEEGYARETISSRYLWVSRLYSELSSFLNGPQLFEDSPLELLKENNKTRNDYLPKESEISQKKRHYYVDKEDLEALCESVPSPAFRNECLIRLMWTAGLRGSEICELKVSNIDTEDNLLEGFWVPKTSKSRSIWVPEETMWFLTQYLEGGYRSSFSYAEESEFLFLTNSSDKMHKQRPNKIVKQAAEEGDIQEELGTTQSGAIRYKVTAHALRRGHGMHLWQEGKDLRTIQRRFGHSSMKQTEDYLPITVEESKQKLEDVQF